MYVRMQTLYTVLCNSLAKLEFGKGVKIEALLSVQNEKSRSELGMLSDNKSMGGSPGSLKEFGETIARKA